MSLNPQLLASTKEHNTFFYWCNDIDKMRHFYSELLGLEETYYQNDSERGWYSCLAENIQLVCVRAGLPLPVRESWEQPIDDENSPTWQIKLPMETLLTALNRLKTAGVQSIKSQDNTIIVFDPMGSPIQLQAA